MPRDNEYVKAAGWGVVDMYAQFNSMQELQLNVGLFNLFDKEYTRYERIACRDAGSDNSMMT